jgi:hypothetical protein
LRALVTATAIVEGNPKISDWSLNVGMMTWLSVLHFVHAQKILSQVVL